MNEHTTPEAPQRPPGQLVEFPVPRPTPATTRSSRTYWLIGGLLSLFLVAAVVAAWWTLGAGTTVHYTTMPVTRGAIARTVTASGTVNPELTIIVGTYVSGVIQQLYCDYNTQVKKGQICAKIDPRPYQTLVDQAKANLAVAKAQLEKDKANLAYTKHVFERATKLLQTNVVSQDAFESRKNDYEQALAQITFDEAIQHRSISTTRISSRRWMALLFRAA
jgi:HlyD family secretion protein